MLKSLFEAVKKRAIFNLTRRELSSLSDRELSDLGLNRSMINSIAHENAYGNQK